MFSLPAWDSFCLKDKPHAKFKKKDSRGDLYNLLHQIEKNENTSENQKLAHFPKNTELSYGSEFSSGLDLIAAIDGDIVLPKMERVLIPAGISIEM